MPDIRKLMAELQQDAADLQRELRGLAAASEALVPVTVQDEQNVVTLTLATNGTVESLVLDEDWRDEIGEEALAAAVTWCYQAAFNQRIGTWLQGSADNSEKAAAEADIPPVVPAPVQLGDPTTTWAQEGREQLRALYEAADAEQGAFVQRQAERARQPRDGVNRAKTVAVTREGGSITRVTLDERWVRTANDSVIEREIVRAINGVLTIAENERESRFEGFPAIEEIMKVGTNPTEMMRRMGAIR
jgi:DNA-binding protein YbaB